MKKAVYFIPLILLVGLVAFLYPIGLYGGWVIYTAIALFLLSGVLLTKRKWWGGIFGIPPGIGLICEYFDNIIHHLGNIDLVVGIMLILFYALCSAQVFYSAKKAQG